MPERSNGPVLKTGVALVATVGSNPTLSASFPWKTAIRAAGTQHGRPCWVPAGSSLEWGRVMNDAETRSAAKGWPAARLIPQDAGGFRIVGQVVPLVRVGLVIVQFRAVLAFIPFGVAIPLAADASAHRALAAEFGCPAALLSVDHLRDKGRNQCGPRA